MNFQLDTNACTLAWYVAETGIRRHVRSIARVARHIGTDDMGARSGPPYPSGELGELMAVVDQTAEAVQAHQIEIASRSRDVEQVNRMLRALSGINTLIVRVRDRDEVFREACRIAVDEGGFRMAMLSLVDRSAMKIVPVASAGVDEKLLSAIKTRLSASNGGTSALIAQAIREEKAVVSNDSRSDPRVSFGQGYADAGVRSMAILPLIVSNEAIGVLALYAAKPGFFDEKENKLLTQLADDIAFAIDHLDDQERLENSNKAKDAFLSVMSHELRTPLNIILGYSNLIKDGAFGEINEEQGKAIGITLTHSKNLLGMVDEILQATRIEGQVVQIVRNEFDLIDFIDDLKSAFELPKDKTLELNWDYSSDLTSIYTDREKLMHILRNLVQNAIKFTQQGTIGISAQLASDRETMEFKVTDTGIGIPGAELAVIFEKFRQVDGSGTRLHEGTGLGLFIVKSFTELLGGSVNVESAVGKGTVFTVRIPCGINQSAMKPITTSLPLGNQQDSFSVPK